MQDRQGWMKGHRAVGSICALLCWFAGVWPGAAAFDKVIGETPSGTEAHLPLNELYKRLRTSPGLPFFDGEAFSLVWNGSFEKGMAGWTLAGDAGTDADRPAEGAVSVRLSLGQLTYTDPLQFVPGKLYSLRLKYRTESLTPGDQLKIAVEFRDRYQRRLTNASFHELAFVRGTHDWQDYEATFLVPEDADQKAATLSATVRAAGGKLWLDNLSIAPMIRPAPALYRFDFQNTPKDCRYGDKAAFPGFVPVDPATRYSPQRGYGWQSVSGIGGHEQDSPDELSRDFVETRGAHFLLNTPRGECRVWVLQGRQSLAAEIGAVVANGKRMLPSLPSDWGQFASRTFDVTVRNPPLKLTTAGPLNAMMVYALESPESRTTAEGDILRVESVIAAARRTWTSEAFTTGREIGVCADPFQAFGVRLTFATLFGQLVVGATSADGEEHELNAEVTVPYTPLLFRSDSMHVPAQGQARLAYALPPGEHRVRFVVHEGQRVLYETLPQQPTVRIPNVPIFFKPAVVIGSTPQVCGRAYPSANFPTESLNVTVGGKEMAREGDTVLIPAVGLTSEANGVVIRVSESWQKGPALETHFLWRQDRPPTWLYWTRGQQRAANEKQEDDRRAEFQVAHNAGFDGAVLPGVAWWETSEGKLEGLGAAIGSAHAAGLLRTFPKVSFCTESGLTDRSPQELPGFSPYLPMKFANGRSSFLPAWEDAKAWQAISATATAVAKAASDQKCEGLVLDFESSTVQHGGLLWEEDLQGDGSKGTEGHPKWQEMAVAGVGYSDRARLRAVIRSRGSEIGAALKAAFPDAEWIVHLPADPRAAPVRELLTGLLNAEPAGFHFVVPKFEVVDYPHLYAESQTAWRLLTEAAGSNSLADKGSIVLGANPSDTRLTMEAFRLQWENLNRVCPRYVFYFPKRRVSAGGQQAEELEVLRSLRGTVTTP